MSYYERLKDNKCTICNNLLDRKGALCKACLEKRRLRKINLKIDGKCRCGRDREDLALANCKLCLETTRVRRKSQRKEWLENDKCTICGADKADVEYAICISCRQQDLVYRVTTKAKVFNHYGNKCNCCGEDNLAFLTIDHIEGRVHGSTKDTKKGMKIYQYLIANNFPLGYQVLCYNCNCAKRDFGYCPHVKKTTPSKWMLFKKRVYANYGSKCVCCGEAELSFLTLDHINGDGTKHRKELKAQGITIFKWLRENNYPPSMQILCFNCNSAKTDEG